MSQQQTFGSGGGGGSLPDNVPQSFVLDDGTAIPAAHVLNVNGASTSDPNDNGILTRANPDLSENAEVVLTNRLTGTVTSTNGSVEDLITIALGTDPACYRFNFIVTGLAATGDGLGYSVDATVKTDGATATLVASPFTDNDEDPSLLDAEITVVASGNSAVLQVTGVTGETIAYKAVGTYVVVS